MTDGDSFNRRTVLKSISATAVGAGGYVTNAAAGEELDSAAEANEVLQVEQVQRVLREVGFPKPVPGRKFSQQLGDSGTELTAYVYQTPIGELRYTEVSSHKVAQFIFDGDVTGNELPDRYEIVSEVESAALVTDMEGGVEFFRSPTRTERNQLSDLRGVDLTGASAYYSTALDGFSIIADGSKLAEATVLKPNASGSGAVNTTDLNPSAASTGEVDATDLASRKTIQPMEKCDTGACAVCLSNIGGIPMVCGVACAVVASPPPVSIAGAVACLTCMAAQGVSLGYFCSECLDTCK